MISNLILHLNYQFILENIHKIIIWYYMIIVNKDKCK
jgi:hypothetical protein